MLSYLGDTQGAIVALRKAVEADPNDFEAQVALGAVLHMERDLDEARLHLQRALQLKPDSNLARYEWARLERTEGHVEAAVKDFEKVLHDDPDWAQPHVEMAALYFRMNRQADGDRNAPLSTRSRPNSRSPDVARALACSGELQFAVLSSTADKDPPHAPRVSHDP